jgi:hypothetical protein
MGYVLSKRTKTSGLPFRSESYRDGLRFCSPQEVLPGGDPESVKYDHHERGAATGDETAPKGTGNVTSPY